MVRQCLTHAFQPSTFLFHLFENGYAYRADHSDLVLDTNSILWSWYLLGGKPLGVFEIMVFHYGFRIKSSSYNKVPILNYTMVMLICAPYM